MINNYVNIGKSAKYKEEIIIVVILNLPPNKTHRRTPPLKRKVTTLFQVLYFEYDI